MIRTSSPQTMTHHNRVKDPGANDVKSATGRLTRRLRCDDLQLRQSGATMSIEGNNLERSIDRVGRTNRGLTKIGGATLTTPSRTLVLASPKSLSRLSLRAPTWSPSRSPTLGTASLRLRRKGSHGLCRQRLCRPSATTTRDRSEDRDRRERDDE